MASIGPFSREQQTQHMFTQRENRGHYYHPPTHTSRQTGRQTVRQRDQQTDRQAD